MTEIPEIDETWLEIQRLPARQRQVVVLHFYEDLPLVEIAHLLGTPAGSQVRSSASAGADRRPHRRTSAGIAAALTVVVASVALWQVTELRDDTPATQPDTPRTSGTIDDPFDIDLDPWRVGAVERTVELRGTTVTIGDRALWWSEQGVGIRIDVLDERTDGLDEAIELAKGIELEVIERLPGWTPPDRRWDVDHGDVALAGLIDGTPWELRVDNGSSTSVLIDGRPVAWGSQPGSTSLDAVGVGEGVIVFGLAPANLDSVVVHLSGTAIQVSDRDGTPIASASSGGDSAAIDMIDPALSVDC